MRKIILYIFLVSGLANFIFIQAVVDNYFYYGNGVSFKVPDQWQIDKNELLSGSEVSRYFVQQSNIESRLIFNLETHGHNQPILFEKWAGSISYSTALKKSVSSIIYSYLDRIKCKDIIQNESSEPYLLVDGIRSVHSRFKCRKNKVNYLHLSTLIPTGQSFTLYHAFIPEKYEDGIKASYYSLLKSFIGARVSESSTNNFGILLQVLVICTVLIVIRLFRTTSDK